VIVDRYGNYYQAPVGAYGGFSPTIFGLSFTLNHTTSFAYDSNGNLTGVTDALNHQTTAAYNSAGQPISDSSPRDKTWRDRF
jgi:YD repeat-containing protein